VVLVAASPGLGPLASRWLPMPASFLMAVLPRLVIATAFLSV
jgi:hypothetical protein